MSTRHPPWCPLVGDQSLWPFCFLSSKHHQSVLEIEVIETLWLVLLQCTFQFLSCLAMQQEEPSHLCRKLGFRVYLQFWFPLGIKVWMTAAGDFQLNSLGYIIFIKFILHSNYLKHITNVFTWQIFARQCIVLVKMAKSKCFFGFFGCQISNKNLRFIRKLLILNLVSIGG